MCGNGYVSVILSHENRFALGPKKGIKYLIFLSVIG